MSQPVALSGDVIINQPSDSSAGTGALKVFDYLSIGSTADVTATPGPGLVALYLPGGGYVDKNFVIKLSNTVKGASILQQTDITTDNGVFNVHGASASSITSSASTVSLTTSGLFAINLNSGKQINLTANTGNVTTTATAGSISSSAFSGISQTVTNPGDITLSTFNGKVVVTGSNNLASAVSITTSGPASGITMSAGTTGITGSSTGPILLSAANALSSITLATAAAGQDLAFTLTGATASRIVSTSSGTGVDAIRNTASAGGITQTALSNLTQTVTAGGFALSSTGASSSIIQTASANGQNFAIQSLGNFNTTMLLSTGSNSATGMTFQALNGGFASTNLLGHSWTSSAGPFNLTSTGGVTGSTISAQSTTNAMDFTIALLDNGTHQSRLLLTAQGLGNDAMRFTSSTGGLTQSMVTNWTSSVSAGPMNFTSTLPVSATSGSSILQYSTASSQDLAISLLGAGAGPGTSRLVLSSAGTGSDSLRLTTSAGGITALAAGAFTLDSLSTSTGITIGTSTANIPVTIGKTGNTVTINSDVIFTGAFTIQSSGGVTGLETTETLIQDRAVVINSNPKLGGDSSWLQQRYQSLTGLSDDVLSDVPNLTGTASAAGSTTTLILANNASAVNGYYIGYYVLITNGAGKNSISRITAYTGSSRTATVNPPFSAASDTTTVYSLYGNVYGALVLKGATKRYELMFTSVDFEVYGTTIQPSTYAPLYLQNLTTVPGAGYVSTDSIYGSTNTGINVSGVIVKDGTLSNVTTINGTIVPQTIYVSITVSNLVGSTAILTPLNSTATGSYIIIVNSDQNTNSTGPTGVWLASRSQASRAAVPQQLNQSAGTTSLLGDRLTITWNANSSATLSYTTLPLNYTPTTNGTYKFIVAITSVQTIAP